MGIGKFLGKLAGAVPGGQILKQAVGFLSRYAETPAQRKALQEMAQKALADSDNAQVELNKIGAAHRSVFVAGWRPFLGWIGGFAIGYPAIRYMVSDIANMFGAQLPPLAGDYTDYLRAIITPMIMGMLGLGAMRTLEKRAGVAH